MEIVIENPVESPPPPPPPPPPSPPPPPPPLPSPSQQPFAMSTWNAIVTAPSTTYSSSTVPSTSMPAATTVMTITIAENPTATPAYPPPVRFSYRETYAANPLPFATGDPYPARRGQHRGGRRSYDDPEGASPSMRRVDKSGLLGITEPEASGNCSRIGSRSPRFLSPVNSAAASGMLSPRRFECVGQQLDPVPEVPGQATRANAAPGVSPVFPVASTSNLPFAGMASMLGQEGRDPCETLSVVNLGRPTKSASFDSLESRRRNDRADVVATLQGLDRHLDGVESSSSDTAGYVSSFRLRDSCEARGRTLGRLSRLALVRNDRDETLEKAVVARYSDTCRDFPFASVRAPTAFPGFEGASILPSTRVTATTVTTSTTTVTVSPIRETDRRPGGKENVEDLSDRAPDEERAEAEGCEHGSTRDPLKDEEESSSHRADEYVDNDGVQTLRVIILSEQL